MMLTRRSFINLAGASALGIAVLALPGCGEPRGAAQPSSASTSTSSTSSAASTAAKTSSGTSQPSATSSTSASSNDASDSLVVYFSHTGENYGVGVIEEGNTAIVAKIIAESTGAGLFEVVPTEAYPESYDECCDVALAEQNAAARPAIAGDVDIAPYKTIYLGYPIWWGDLPMCLYTFLEAHDWTNKEIRPFCTHAGSGLAGTVASVQGACAGANIGQGLSIVGTIAQNSRSEARSAVEAWLG